MLLTACGGQPSTTAAPDATTPGSPTSLPSTAVAPAPSPPGTPASVPGSAQGGTTPAAAPDSVPGLPTGEFAGRFTGVDTTTAIGRFAVRCPAADRGRQLTVSLRTATFEDTSNRADPAAGHALDLTLAQWARRQAGSEWNVTVAAPGTPVLIRSTSLPSDHTVC